MIRTLNVLAIYILVCVLLGAYTYQIIYKESPCPLCELQRLAMICVSIGLMANLKFGMHMRHYAIALGGAILGGSISMRQILLHICPGFPEFGIRVFGFELYTWAFFVFCSILIGLFFLMLSHQDEDRSLRPSLFLYEKIAIILMMLVALANVVTGYFICRFGPCPG